MVSWRQFTANGMDGFNEISVDLATKVARLAV